MPIDPVDLLVSLIKCKSVTPNEGGALSIIEDVLRRNAMPYVIVGGVKFYDRKEIKDVIAYLRLLVNEFDLISLERIINFPARGIGKTTVKKIIDLAQKKSINVIELFNSSKILNSDKSPLFIIRYKS